MSTQGFSFNEAALALERREKMMFVNGQPGAWIPKKYQATADPTAWIPIAETSREREEGEGNQ